MGAPTYLIIRLLPRKAGKPKGREAEKPKGGNPGSRGPKRPRCRLCLGQADQTKPRVRLPHITGMPRCHTACHDTEATWRQEGLVFSPHYFPVKASRLPNP